MDTTQKIILGGGVAILGLLLLGGSKSADDDLGGFGGFGGFGDGGGGTNALEDLLNALQPQDQIQFVNPFADAAAPNQGTYEIRTNLMADQGGAPLYNWGNLYHTDPTKAELSRPGSGLALMSAYRETEAATPTTKKSSGGSGYGSAKIVETVKKAVTATPTIKFGTGGIGGGIGGGGGGLR